MSDIKELRKLMSANKLDFDALQDLCQRSQNGPPDGEGDSTIDETTWLMLRDAIYSYRETKSLVSELKARLKVGK